MMFSLNKKNKISFFDHLYYTKINKYQVIYNPYSYKGPAVIPLNSFALLKKVLNGKNTVKDILDDQITLDLLNNLCQYDLLSVDGEKNHMFANPLSNPEKASFWIDVTNQCNFRCTYCYIDRKKEVIDPDRFMSLFDKLMTLKNDYPFKEIVLVLAGGEPLLYFEVFKKLIKTIQTLQQKYSERVKFQTIVITNGSLLTEEKAVFLRKNGIRVAISLDGIGEYNNKTRKFIDGSGTFKYVLKGLEIAKKNNILSNVITTVSSKNINHLPQLVSFLLSKEVGFQLQFYKKTTQFCLDEAVVFDKKAIDSYLKTIKVVYDYYDSKPKSKKRLSIFLESSKALFFTSEYSCAAGYNYFTITQNCELKVCPASNIKIPFDKVANFISVLREKNKKFIQYSVNSNPICKKCLWKYACKGGCKMEKFVAGTTKSTPNICSFYKKMLPYLIKLEAQSIIRQNRIASS